MSSYMHMFDLLIIDTELFSHMLVRAHVFVLISVDFTLIMICYVHLYHHWVTIGEYFKFHFWCRSLDLEYVNGKDKQKTQKNCGPWNVDKEKNRAFFMNRKENKQRSVELSRNEKSNIENHKSKATKILWTRHEAEFLRARSNGREQKEDDDSNINEWTSQKWTKTSLA